MACVSELFRSESLQARANEPRQYPAWTSGDVDKEGRWRARFFGLGAETIAGMTYVALTSSFAGTGGIAVAMSRVGVACTGALFEGDFLRLKSGIFGDEDEDVAVGRSQAQSE